MKPTVATCGLPLAVFFVSALCIATPSAYAGEPARMSGDVNCDNNVDLSDIIVSLNWLFQGGTEPCEVPDPPELVDRIAELEADVAEREAEIARLEAELKSADTALAETETALNDCTAGLATCQGELDTSGDALTACATDLDASEEALAAAEDRIAELEVPGCTDPEADNYDCAANVEDGSCEFSGCTDPKAQNFDPAANVDDGSCCYSDGECSDIDGFTYLQENDQGYDEFRHDETGIDFVLVPGGEFEMGSPDSEPNRDEDEGPVHTVTLSPFLIAKYECTQAQYAQVMQGHPTLEATASLSPNPSRFTGDVQRPVEQVSWTDLKDADGFLARTGLSLPSEAQWEYACRGGTTTVFSFGDECNNDEGNVHTCNPCAAADDSMWWCGNAGRTTHPVGEKLPNPFGLHDMHGNVFEWCQDWFKDGFYDELVDSGEPAIDPICRDSGSGFRVFRGGSWNDYAWGCRSADRYGYRPDNRDSNYGFRPLRPLP